MEKKPKVDTRHPLYEGLQKKRNDFAAVLSTDAIRAGGQTYLPKYQAESTDDYKKRLESATIDGLVMGGVDTLTGKVFDEEIDVSGVTLDAALLENFDNEGTTFNTFARTAFEMSFDGFSLIVVDMPAPNDEAAQLLATYGKEGEAMLKLRPFCRLYNAASVVNWHYETNPATQIKQLTMIVLREVSERIVDRFERANVERYRVMSVDNGVVTWELWEEREETNSKEDKFILVGGGTITGVTEIPVSFVGKVTDEPKLLTEARLEIKAYQKESSFDTIEYMSVPIFFTRGYPDDRPSPALGASAHLRLPALAEADAGYIQLDSAGHESLKGTVREIKDTIRGRISQMADVHRAASAQITATETMTADKDNRARLVVWAEELHEGLERALQFMGQFAGKGEDGAGTIQLMPAWRELPLPEMPNDGGLNV